MSNIITINTDKQVVNAKLASWTQQRHVQLDESPAIIASAVYHGLQHGDFSKLRAYVNTLGNTERNAVLAAVLACAKLEKSAKRANDNTPLFFVRIGGNMHPAAALRAAQVIPDWRVAYEARKAEQRAARQAKKAETVKAEHAEKAEEMAEKAAKGTGNVHFRADILALAQKIRQAKSQKQTTISEAALLDAYVSFVEGFIAQQSNKEPAKKTGTHN